MVKAIERESKIGCDLIDGGKGNSALAKAVFESLDVSWDKNHPLLLGVARAIVKPGWRRCSSSRKVRALCRRIPRRCMLFNIFAMSRDHAISGHRKKRAR